MENFEEILRKDLHQFLISMKEVLPDGSSHSTEAHGLSHDEDELNIGTNNMKYVLWAKGKFFAEQSGKAERKE